MPLEYSALKDEVKPLEICPKCKAIFEPFLRGLVQRMWKRKYIFFGKYEGYCAVICRACKEIVGWE